MGRGRELDIFQRVCQPVQWDGGLLSLEAFGRIKTNVFRLVGVFLLSLSLSLSLCVFIKLHITAQSGLVILVILCHLH